MAEVGHQLKTIPTRLLGIANNHRTEGVHRWLSHVEARLCHLFAGDVEKDVFSTLVSKYCGQIAEGKLQKSDYKIAAQIASGVLSGDAVVCAVIQSCSCTLDKMKRGKLQRVGTSKFTMNTDVIEAYIHTVGHAKESALLLQRFGVNAKPMPKQLSANMEMFNTFS